MKSIIALRGKGNSGKTTTIRILYNLLLASGYVLQRSNFHVDGGDFIAIFKKGNTLIGITSSGDRYDLVHEGLQEMIDEGCEVCVCACRTYDRLPPGTNAAVLEFEEYENEFMEKTIDEPRQQLAINTLDAQRLLERIDARI